MLKIWIYGRNKISNKEVLIENHTLYRDSNVKDTLHVKCS